MKVQQTVLAEGVRGDVPGRRMGSYVAAMCMKSFIVFKL